MPAPSTRRWLLLAAAVAGSALLTLAVAQSADHHRTPGRRDPRPRAATVPAVTTDWYALYRKWEAKHGDRYTDSQCGGDVAWGESYVLRMYVNLYEAFRERLWLDKMVAHVDRVLARLHDRPPDPPYKRYDPRYIDGFYGWGQNRYYQYRAAYTEWFCDDG